MGGPLSSLALLLHLALVALAAPALDSVMRRLATSWQGQSPAPATQPWRDLVKLWRKSAPLPAAATYVFQSAPAIALATAAVAAMLVPSFSLGVAGAGLADLVVVVAMLAASRAAPALAAHDAGWAASAQQGGAAMSAMLGPAPVLLVVVTAVALLSGGTNLVQAAAAVRDGGAVAHAAGLLAGSAVLAVVAVLPPAPDTGAGRHGALLLLASQLRLIAGLSMVAALALPFGVAPDSAGLLAWLWGAVCWAAKLACLAVLATAIRTWSYALPTAALLALGAVVLASLGGRA